MVISQRLSILNISLSMSTLLELSYIHTRTHTRARARAFSIAFALVLPYQSTEMTYTVSSGTLNPSIPY